MKEKRYVIKFSDGNYYDCWTMIGPKFGVTKEQAKSFYSKESASLEMLRHWAFATCEIEEI